MPVLINLNEEEVVYDGFEFEHPNYWYVSILGEYYGFCPIITIACTDVYADAIKALNALRSAGKLCGVEYILTRGDVQIDPDELDSNGKPLPDDDELDFGGPNDINPFTRGMFS